jgi:hypothetical protein
MDETTKGIELENKITRYLEIAIFFLLKVAFALSILTFVISIILFILKSDENVDYKYYIFYNCADILLIIIIFYIAKYYFAWCKKKPASAIK